jgi:peptide/nickel transport system permease protein
MGRRAKIGGGFLAALVLVAAIAPWLGLRDPAAQPDGLVLRDLPPGSRVDAVRLADGTVRYAHEVRELADGSVEIRRGERRVRVPAGELAGPRESDWHGRPLFLLGTDGYGRDMLSRMVYGARVSLLVGAIAALMALLVGALVGTVAGTLGGWVDVLLMRATDLVLAVPRLFLALMLVAIYGASLTTTILVLGGTTWMAAARLVRGEILSLRERDFVQAARASGAPPSRVGLRHLLPSAAAPLLVEGTLRVGETILLEAALSFLGLGVPPPSPSWGNLIADGRDTLLDAWWVSTLPGLAIAATVIALNLVGDAARERATGRKAVHSTRNLMKIGSSSSRASMNNSNL